LKCDSVNMLKKFFENVNRQIKAPLTFVLSRRGREEMEEKEGKDFQSPLTLPSPAEWRGKKKGERGLKKNLLN
jgi:hypothetical protein